MGFPAALLRGFVPDEVIDEVLAAGGRPPRPWPGPPPSATGSTRTWCWRWSGWSRAFRPDGRLAQGRAGLMQLMPAHRAELGVADAFDPATNLDGGPALSQRCSRYAATWAGPGRVQRGPGRGDAPRRRAALPGDAGLREAGPAPLQQGAGSHREVSDQ